VVGAGGSAGPPGITLTRTLSQREIENTRGPEIGEGIALLAAGSL